MKTTSRFALVAAAGLLLGAAYTPAKAADLGGGCCADLEERVAELEATTARKGNRVVSLQVYGQVNKALMIWDDGIDSDAYIVDHSVSGSRLGLKGEAKISSTLTAGYRMEFELGDTSSASVDQLNDDGNGEKVFSIRQNYLYLDSKQLGRITIGHQSSAADGAAEVVLGNSLSNSNVIVGRDMYVRQSNGAAFGDTLGDWANNRDGNRLDLIRYDSPSIAGFLLSASFGEDDYADVALRFIKEFNSIRVAAGIGYAWTNDNSATGAGSVDVEEIIGTVSVMHVPTGLYVAAAAMEVEAVDFNVDNESMWYVQAGIEKKFLPYGTTTIYGEYGEYDNMFAVRGLGAVNPEATRWGFGLNQKIDAAAMDIYAQATFWDLEADNAPNVEDMSTVMVGSRIKF